MKKSSKSFHKKVAEVYDDVYGDDHVEEQKLDKRAAKAKKLMTRNMESAHENNREA